jgi:hypothetical protein
MRLGVTGRSRTGTGGATSRSSAIELRPHPSAREGYCKEIPRALARRSSSLRSAAVASRLATPRT